MRDPKAPSNLESQLAAYAAAVKSVRQSADWNSRLSRWPMYAAAAGAVLASATSADASIITGNAGLTISINPSGPGVSQNIKPILLQTFFGSTLGKLRIGLTYRNSTTGSVSSAFHVIKGSAGLSVQGSGRLAVSSKVVRRFLAGNPIRASLMGSSHGGFLHYKVFSQNTANPLSTYGSTIGNFASGVTGIAGFQLPNGDLGWIELKWTSSTADGYPDQLQALDWAVNDTPGQGIVAGQDIAAVPEPGTASLAMLAFGAGGILAWRKRQQAA